MGAEAVKTRLRDELKSAMRLRDALRIRVCRGLIAALDNAEAVPVGDKHERYVVHAFGDRSAEVERLILSPGDIVAIFAEEARSRRTAAGQIAAGGRPDAAADLIAEADLIERLAVD